jgi:predicted ABC-type transport system involved in lysophospholipase L1 biosynthesis ATPase subunit
LVSDIVSHLSSPLRLSPSPAGTIDKPSKGELFLAGKRITSATTDDEFARLRLQNIGFVFQQFNLISTMTAKENVSLPMTLFGKLTRAEVADRAQALLDMVGIGPRSHHLPSQLSGGEQQRYASPPHAALACHALYLTRLSVSPSA